MKFKLSRPTPLFVPTLVILVLLLCISISYAQEAHGEMPYVDALALCAATSDLVGAEDVGKQYHDILLRHLDGNQQAVTFAISLWSRGIQSEHGAGNISWDEIVKAGEQCALVVDVIEKLES